MEQAHPPVPRLSRLGLGHAALKAAILAELDRSQFSDDQAESLSEAVADAVDANNAELLRQLRQILFSE